jgi:hypothetical protein
MKIVITGGKHEADFIVKMLKEEHHQFNCHQPRP